MLVNERNLKLQLEIDYDNDYGDGYDYNRCLWYQWERCD